MAVTIQIRRDQASDWTAANPILAEGEMGLELDTGLRKIGDGVTVWTSLAYYDNQTSAPATDITYDNTTSGLTATDVQAALDEIDAQVDTNTAAIALPPEQFAARKNLLINGGFDVWQRGTSFPNLINTYGPDRWRLGVSVGGQGVDRLVVIDDTADEAYYAARLTKTASSQTTFVQRVEGARVFAGRTVTVSFLARASVARANTIRTTQVPSGTTVSTDIGVANITTAFTKFTFTTTLDSLAGFGDVAGSYTEVVFADDDAQAGTIDYANVQLELGDTATDFEYRPIAEELGLCQRYYFKPATTSFYGCPIYNSTSVLNRVFFMYWPMTMRAQPTVAFGQVGWASVATVVEADYIRFLGDADGAVVASSVNNIAADAEL